MLLIPPRSVIGTPVAMFFGTVSRGGSTTALTPTIARSISPILRSCTCAWPYEPAPKTSSNADTTDARVRTTVNVTNRFGCDFCRAIRFCLKKADR